MTCVSHYGTVCSSFVALNSIRRIINSSSVLHLFIPPSPRPLTSTSFQCCHNFAFYRMSYNWNHTLCILFSDLFYLIICTSGSSMPFHGFLSILKDVKGHIQDQKTKVIENLTLDLRCPSLEPSHLIIQHSQQST